MTTATAATGTTPTTTPTTAPVLLAGLLDDAAIFPPGNAPMAAALAAHAGHRTAPHAGLVGPFLCSDARWAELACALDAGAHARGPGPLEVSLVVTGGAPGLAPAVAAAAATDGVRLVSLEVPAGDPAAVTRTADVLRTELPDGVRAFVEVPLGSRLDEALDRLAATPHRAKLRTGGTTAAAFPDEPSLATALLACRQRGLAVKLTAGLHGALRHRDPATGFEHHGFLNVLLAVAAGLDGAPVAELTRLLGLTEPEVVRRLVRELPEEQAAAVRRTFASFGTCSIDEPVADLVSLGLLTLEQAP